MIADTGTTLANYISNRPIHTWNDTVKIREMKKMLRMAEDRNRNKDGAYLQRSLTMLGQRTQAGRS